MTKDDKKTMKKKRENLNIYTAVYLRHSRISNMKHSISYLVYRNLIKLLDKTKNEPIMDLKTS